MKNKKIVQKKCNWCELHNVVNANNLCNEIQITVASGQWVGKVGQEMLFFIINVMTLIS